MKKSALTRRRLFAAICISLAACLFLCSCYMSEAMRFDSRSDARQDPVQDPAAEDRRDVPDAPDTVDMPDLPDVADMADTADVPEEELPPFNGITFIIQNNDSDPTGIPYYFPLEGGGDITNHFPMEQVIGVDRVRVSWVPPWCTVSCENYEDGCCIDCAFMPAVRVLEPGESITIHWDGTFFGMDSDLCDCGCYFPYRVAEGLFDIMVCGYTDYECWAEPCEPGEGGMIWDAQVIGDSDCITYGFEIPGDSGETMTFYFPPGER
ncbi:MAG: hypothetical protein ABIJ56_08875 [Pseudomonadota bacterium]